MSEDKSKEKRMQVAAAREIAEEAEKVLRTELLEAARSAVAAFQAETGLQIRGINVRVERLHTPSEWGRTLVTGVDVEVDW